MTDREVFTRMVTYGLVLGVADAVGGRLLQAATDPSVVLALGATGWAAYRLAEGAQSRIAVVAGLTLWVAYMAAFVAMARLLVGWNGSVPWQPHSTMWAVGFAATAVVVAIVGRFAGSRAARRPGNGAAGHPA